MIQVAMTAVLPMTRLSCPACTWRGRQRLKRGRLVTRCRRCFTRLRVPFSASAGVRVELHLHGRPPRTRLRTPRHGHRPRWSGWDGLEVATKGAVPALLGACSYALLGGAGVSGALSLLMFVTALVTAAGAVVVALGGYDIARATLYRLFGRRDPLPAGALLLDDALARVGL